jgi:hypothetical protein
MSQKMFRKKESDMAHGVCPWWIGYLLASPLRRLLTNPSLILDSLVHEGMTVFEPGPGMGFLTLRWLALWVRTDA